LSFTKVFDLTGMAAGPSGGAVNGGVNAFFRNSCFAVSGSSAYLVEYGSVITDGPSCYYSSNITTATAADVSWSNVKTWANSKHAHAVKIIGGVPWVTHGDSTFTDLGVWTATNAAAGTWNRRSQYGELNNGNMQYGINMVTMTIDGVPVVAMEYDGYGPSGPLVHPSQDPTKPMVTTPICTLPLPYIGSMRGLTLTEDGNLMWYTTSEGGAIGTTGSIWLLGAPYRQAVLLETFDDSAAPLETVGDPVESGNFIWFGRDRIRKEKFIGQ